MVSPLLIAGGIAGTLAMPWLLRQLFGSPYEEVRPTYPWETALGRELMARLLTYTPPAYMGALEVPLTPTELSLAQALATPVDVGTARRVIEETLAGRYLDVTAQPFVQAMAQEIQRRASEQARQTMDVLASQVGRAGVVGGSAHQRLAQQVAERVAEQTAGQLAQLYGGLYAQERARQLQAVPLALQTAVLPLQQAQAGLQAQQYLRQAMLQNILLPYQEFVARRQLEIEPLRYLTTLATAQPIYPMYRPSDIYAWLYPMAQIGGTMIGYGLSGAGGLGGGTTGGGTTGTITPTTQAVAGALA